MRGSVYSVYPIKCDLVFCIMFCCDCIAPIYEPSYSIPVRNSSTRDSKYSLRDLHAEFISGNVRFIFVFLSILDSEITQIIKMLPCGKKDIFIQHSHSAKNLGKYLQVRCISYSWASRSFWMFIGPLFEIKLYLLSVALSSRFQSSPWAFKSIE